MALRLIPNGNVPAAYEYFRASRPFCTMKLPHADEVGFRVTRHRDRFGHMDGYVRSEEADICVSEAVIGSTGRLMETMAHEMIHLYQHRRRSETPGTQHNAEFRRIARQVCAEHGFDLKAFV